MAKTGHSGIPVILGRDLYFEECRKRLIELLRPGEFRLLLLAYSGYSLNELSKMSDMGQDELRVLYCSILDKLYSAGLSVGFLRKRRGQRHFRVTKFCDLDFHGPELRELVGRFGWDAFGRGSLYGGEFETTEVKKARGRNRFSTALHRVNKERRYVRQAKRA